MYLSLFNLIIFSYAIISDTMFDLFLILINHVEAKFFFFRDRPSTPERDQSSIRERHRQHLLQMTDPDHRRNRSHNRIPLTTSEEGFPQPIFTPAVHIQHSNMGGNDLFLDRATATSIIHSGLSSIRTSEAILPFSSSGIVHSGPPAVDMLDVVHSGPLVI
jgi:hypothetical protein